MDINAYYSGYSAVKKIKNSRKNGDQHKERAAELKKKLNIKLFLEDSSPIQSVPRHKKQIKKQKKPKVDQGDKRLGEKRRHCRDLKSQLLNLERINLKKHEQCVDLKEKIRNTERMLERRSKGYNIHAEVTDAMIEDLKDSIKNAEDKKREKLAELKAQLDLLKSHLFRQKCNLSALQLTCKEKDLLCRSTLINLKKMKRT